MNSSLSYLANDLLLKQSELFGQEYGKFEIKQIHTFNDITISNLDDWYNSILTKYNFLNIIQISNLANFLKALNYVLCKLHPDKLKINDDSIFEEDELLLWRESVNGISKLIFNKYGDFIYLFNGNDGKKVQGVFDENVDIEKLLYRFLLH